MKKTRFVYPLTAFIICLAAEILIGMFADGWLRYSFGDILVMPAMYFLVRIFTSRLRKTLPIILLGFACFVEFLQSIHICDLLGIPQGSLLRIIIGTTGLWSDILCYIAGTIAVYTILQIENILGGIENDRS
ncbi:MAG: DUF2809 domain-containing protein [Ruminococcus sp.]|nr:DUF2809 domain-containing protein [Oscillospiraceae bacterium]